MGPSNSKTSRAASASAQSASSPSNSSTPSASTTPPSVESGGRVGRLKSTPAARFFSRLAPGDLALVREFRDEIARAESGKWRLIFPIGASSRTSDFSSTVSSYDQYAHLFEVEKYETLLLMRFQKHFDEEVRERICMKAGDVREHEVKDELPSATAGGNGQPSVARSASAAQANAPSKRASTGGALSTGPLSPKSTQTTRHGSANGQLMGANAIPIYTYASASPISAASSLSPPYSTLSSSSSPSSSSASQSPPAAFISEADAHRKLLLGMNVHGSSSSRHLQGAQSPEEEEDDSSHPVNGPLVPSTVSPLDSSPEDSETDSHGRSRRRYFYDRERGVALQPYIPNAPQYHEGWDSRPNSSAGAAAATTAEVAALQQQQLFQQQQKDQLYLQQQYSQRHQQPPSVPTSPARHSRPPSAARGSARGPPIEYQPVSTAVPQPSVQLSTRQHHRSRSSDRPPVWLERPQG